MLKNHLSYLKGSRLELFKTIYSSIEPVIKSDLTYLPSFYHNFKCMKIRGLISERDGYLIKTEVGFSVYADISINNLLFKSSKRVDLSKDLSDLSTALSTSIDVDSSDLILGGVLDPDNGPEFLEQFKKCIELNIRKPKNMPICFENAKKASEELLAKNDCLPDDDDMMNDISDLMSKINKHEKKNY